MRLRQHERLVNKLREAKAAGDVLAVARLQQALAERTMQAAIRAQARREQRINLKTPSAPSRRHMRPKQAAVVGTGAVPAVAVLPAAAWPGWTAGHPQGARASGAPPFEAGRARDRGCAPESRGLHGEPGWCCA